MRFDRRELGRYYASITDEELLALNRDDLTETAQVIYDLELARRELNKNPSSEEETGVNSESFKQADALISGESPDPNWLQNAACVCSFVASPGNSAEERASRSQTALQAAGIPSCLRVTRDSEDGEPSPNYAVLNIMVPVALALHAASMLDRDFLNEEFETEWRAQLNMLPDEDLLALDPAIFCAGLLDRVSRMRKAYAEEMSKRELKPRTV